MRKLLLLLILPCLLAAAPAALAAPPTACGLLTQAEAAEALGMPVSPGKPTGPNAIGQTICFFSGEGDKAVHYVQLSLTLPPPRLRANMPASRIFASSREMTAGAREISDLGDKAFWGGSGLKMGAGLHVLRGNYCFTVDVASGDPEKNLAIAQKLARLVLQRLK